MAENENASVDAPLDGEARSTDETLSTAIEALRQATQVLASAATQMMQAGAGQTTTGATPTQPTIAVWEDDPFSGAVPTPNPTNATPITVNVPTNNFPLLQLSIHEPRPAPARYAPGTANFLYWTAAEALVRGVNFWGPLLPVGTRWSTTNPMRVTLVTGQDLNANYTRQFGLRFYQQTVRNKTFFSGESPNVSEHELGHAILDALRPQLFNANFIEVAAFHEAFGDMSSILSALQLPTMRQKVLSETQGQLNVNSRLSRLAESLGWAIRQLAPSAVDPDSLRNAANSFFYQPPAQLPSSAPASQLSSEVHSFSRVFTGAFLDALARMFTVTGAATDANLLAVSRDMGQLLVDGVRTASITPTYFSQVAAAMIQADRARNNGRYRNALSSGFVQHGILSPAAVTNLADAPVPQLKAVTIPSEDMVVGMADFGSGASGTQTLLVYDDGDDDYRQGAEDVPELPTRSISTDFGLTLLVHAPDEPERFAVAPAALESGSVETPAVEEEARSFVEDLVRLGRVDLGRVEGVASELSFPTGGRTHRQTHVLVDTSEGPVLKRLHFDCGFHCRH